MKKIIDYLLIYIVLLSQISCVSSKKFYALHTEKKALMDTIQYLNYSLDLHRFDKNNLRLYMIEHLKDSLSKPSAAALYPYTYTMYDKYKLQSDSTMWSGFDEEEKAIYSNFGLLSYFKTEMPLVPIPPPMPTNYLEINNKSLRKLKTFSQVDSLISLAFRRAGYTERLYLAVQGGGFAVAIPFEEIDDKGNKLNVSNSMTSLQRLRYLFSFSHINDILYTNDGFSRCIMVMVSDIGSLGGTQMSYDQIKGWLDTRSIRLPKDLASKPLNEDIKLIALLYEFKIKDNTGKASQLLFKSKTNLQSHPIIKFLNDGN